MKYVCSVKLPPGTHARDLLKQVNAAAGEWQKMSGGDDFGLVSMARKAPVQGNEERLLTWNIGPSPIPSPMDKQFEWFGIYCLKDIDKHQCLAWQLLIEKHMKHFRWECRRHAAAVGRSR